MIDIALSACGKNEPFQPDIMQSESGQGYDGGRDAHMISSW